MSRKQVFGSIAILVGAISTANTLAAEPSAADAEFFEKRVRPVLVKNCQECHGEKEQSGGLRLNSRAAILSGGDQGAALSTTDPGKSLLLKAVGYEDEHLQMPPEGKLKAAEIADLHEWVRRGAPWPGDTGVATTKRSGEMLFTPEMKAHWAFQPRGKHPVPNASKNPHPIDAFIEAKLAEAKIASTPRAEAVTLLRRLTFDLTGLPPTPEQTAEFLSSTTPLPERCEQLIDRLLLSPQYGERFARHWLDVARYADSNGSEVDHALANAWRYRDYVVNSFNADKPFDQFVREQIAGDLLHEAGELPDPDSLTATGFLMLGPKALAELDKQKLQADIIDEQVDTVSRAFLGLTMGCCRCHDHKFDPLPTADYYALAGIFRSTRSMDYSKRVATWTERPVGSETDLQRVEMLLARIGDLRKQRDAAGATQASKRETLKLAAGEDYLLIEAEEFRRGNVRVETDSLGKGIGVVRTLMQYPDRIEYEFELPAAGDYQLELRYAAKESRPTELMINGNLVTMAAAGEVTGDWRPSAQKWFVQDVYAFEEGKNTIVFHRDGPVPLFDKILIGKPRKEPYGPNAETKPKRLQVESQSKKELDAAITAAQRELELIPTTLAPFDGPVADTSILIRGNPATPGAVVRRGFPRIISAVPHQTPGAQQSGRLELANWLTHPQHPLTARVIVNRVWLWHFGEGLVRSPDNFGLRGEQPSHPELLDWLATWFIENGWSLKKLHHLICTSETYQRATATRSNPADPENRLLAHFPRRRLTAEQLRDAMLAVSGKLDLAQGGSIMTVLNRTYVNGGTAPADIAEQLNYDSPRRSIYLPIVRTNLHDFFVAFDYPDPAMLTGQRANTTVAPQGLFLMNSPFVKARAAALAKRVQKQGDGNEPRIHALYMLAFNRRANAEESRNAIAYLNQEYESLRRGGDNHPELSAWARLCHALLMSNEFLYLR